MPRRRSDEFGTPTERDGTAQMERVVKSASDRAVRALNNVKEQYPRPLGSRRMSPEHELTEMQLLADHPDLIAEMAARNEWSLETLVDYLERMARKL